jgi:hypothetical protein
MLIILDFYQILIKDIYQKYLEQKDLYVKINLLIIIKDGPVCKIFYFINRWKIYRFIALWTLWNKNDR